MYSEAQPSSTDNDQTLLDSGVLASGGRKPVCSIWELLCHRESRRGVFSTALAGTQICRDCWTVWSFCSRLGLCSLVCVRGLGEGWIVCILTCVCGGGEVVFALCRFS